MAKYKQVRYQYGIFKDISLDAFIEQTLSEEVGWDLFQVVEYHVFSLGGGWDVRYLILKQK